MLTPAMLVRQVRALLDTDDLPTAVLPFLANLGHPALVGGAVRDLARESVNPSSDLDFVMLSGDHHRFLAAMHDARALPNRFGGFRLFTFHREVDVWHISDTWARTRGLRSVEDPRDLLETTFFDWDSILFDVPNLHLVMHDDYLDRLKSNVLDVRLLANPNPTGTLVRAIRRAALWKVQFGPGLSDFSRRQLDAENWDDLVRLDASAFKVPVLCSLNEHALRNALLSSDAQGLTTPVP